MPHHVVRHSLILALAVWFAHLPAAFAQLPTQSFMEDPGAGARSHTIDQQRMIARVSFKPDEGRVIGHVTHHFAPIRPQIDSLWLDGPGIRYESVRLNSRPVPYTVWPQGISIHPDEPLRWDQTDTLDIAYEVQPRHGMYFVGWNDPAGRSRKQIWTQGQGPGHRYWVPLYDYPNDKLITETIVTFDEDYEVLSNGELVNVTDNPDDTRTWHYRLNDPHSGYLMMLGIGNYAVQEMTSESGVPIRNYYYPDQPERAEPTYRYTDRMVDIMERETGVPYPWGTYAQIPVQDFLHGGMENTGATIFTDAYYVDDRGFLDDNYVYVNAHELAHQWFGDLVTQGRAEDTWLHESFASHYGRMLEGEVIGGDHYEWVLKEERDRALSNPDQGPIPIRSTRAGSDLVYAKGTVVLEMLKDMVGREAFNRVVQQYLEEHAYQNIIGPDFFSAFDEVLGLNLDWFFEQWILRGSEPHYDVSYEPVSEGGQDYTAVTVRQIHETGPLVGYFRMPIDFQVHYEDGTVRTERAWVDGAETVVRVENPADKPVDFVVFDPGHNVLKRLTFERSVDELAAQARRAPDMIDRFDALVALRDAPPAQKRDALTSVFRQDASPRVRAEAMAQLAGDEASVPLLTDALDDPSHVVRGVVLRSAPVISDALAPGFERALRDSSYQNIETALLRLADERQSGAERYLQATEGVIGHDDNVRIARLLVAARAGRPGIRDALVDLAGPSHGFRTRLNAFEALEKLGHFDLQAAAHLLDAMAHFNRRLRTPATGFFERFTEADANRTLAEEAFRAGTWTDRQRALLDSRLVEMGS